MNVEHQILQVGIHTGLRINRCLLVCQQVIKLHYSDRYSLEFLRLQQNLFQGGVFDDLVGHDGGEMTGFCNIPPIIAI